MQKSSLKFIVKTLGLFIIPAVFLYITTLPASAAVGLSVGNTGLNLLQSENLYYGNIGASSHASSTFLLFQNNSADRLRIDISGNLTTTGSITANAFTGPITGGSISAANVSAGTFGSNVGNGNFSFPGNVGIGTTNPGALLDVGAANNSSLGLIVYGGSGGSGSTLADFRMYGGTSVFRIAGDGALHVGGVATISGLKKLTISDAAPGGILEIRNTTAGSIASPGETTINFTGPAGTKRAAIVGLDKSQNLTGGWLKFQTTDTSSVLQDRMIIDRAGNVGIGTTTPVYKLDVFGGATTNDLLSVQASDPRIAFKDGVSSSSWYLQAVNGNRFRISYGGGELFSINQSGNIGIGTTTPAARLSISGGNTFINDAAITSGTPKAAITKEYLDSSLSAFASTNNTWILNGSNLYASSTAWNVGIGTTAPGTAKLAIEHSDSSTSINTAAYPLKIRNTSWVGNQITGIEFWNGSLKTVPTARIVSQMNINGAGGENLFLQTQSSSGTNPNPNQPTTKLAIMADGNVGVGTASPYGKLHTVISTAYSNSALFTTSDWSYGSTGTAINFRTGAGTGNTYGVMDVSTVGGANTGNLVINPNGGNVGIGTTNPLYKLDVNGNLQVSDIYNKGTVLRRSPYEYYGVVDISSTLDGTNNTAYINIGTFSDSFTHINIEVELVPWLLNTSNIGSYKKAYALRMTSASPGVVSVYDSRIVSDIGTTGNKYQIGAPEADASNLLRIPIKYIGSGSGNGIKAFVRVTGWTSGNIDKVGLGVIAPSAVSSGAQEFMSFRNRLGIGTTAPQNSLDVSGSMAIGSYSGVNAAPSNSLIVSGNIGIGLTAPTAKLSISGGNAFINDAAITSGTPKAAITKEYLDSSLSAFASTNNTWILNGSNLYASSTAWNVGIGTTTPVATLDVNGTANISSSTSIGANLTVLGQGIFSMGSQASPAIKFGSFSNGFYSSSGGGGSVAVSINGNMTMLALTNSAGINQTKVAANTKLGWSSTPDNALAAMDTGFTRGSANKIYAGNGTAGDFSGTFIAGSVGIGTTTPAARLSISGGNTFINDAAITSGTPKAAITKEYLDSSLSAFASTNNTWILNGSNLYASSTSWNVGIGTTNPGSRLTVSGADNKDAGPILNLSGSSVNQFESGRIRFTETTVAASPFYQGAFLHYDGSANTFNIGVHSAVDSLQASDINAIRILRDNGNVNIGNNALFAQYNGNVGIGTTAPGAKLESVATTEQLRLSYNAANYSRFTVDSSGNLSIHPTSGRTYWNTPSINNYFYVYNNSDGDSYTGIQGNAITLRKTGTQTVYIANSGNTYFNAGNVGIGTSTPAARLSISGGNAFINDAAITSGTPKAAITKEYLDSSLSAFGATNNTWILNGSNLYASSTAWNVGIGTTNPGAKLDLSGSFRTNNSATFSLLNGTGNRVTSVDPSGVLGVTNIFAQSGNVGIGTSNPQAALHVEGGVVLKRTAVADANYTVQATDYIIGYSSITANRTITVPNSVCAPGRFFVVVDESGQASPTRAIIIDPEGSTPIIGAPTFNITGAYNSVYIFCGSNAWYIL